MKTNIIVKMRPNNLTIIMKHGARDRTNNRFRIPQYCSLTILCQLSDQATFISLKKDGYNTETENISQKDPTFGDGTWSGLLAVPALIRLTLSLSHHRYCVRVWQSRCHGSLSYQNFPTSLQMFILVVI